MQIVPRIVSSILAHNRNAYNQYTFFFFFFVRSSNRDEISVLQFVKNFLQLANQATSGDHSETCAGLEDDSM